MEEKPTTGCIKNLIHTDGGITYSRIKLLEVGSANIASSYSSSNGADGNKVDSLLKKKSRNCSIDNSFVYSLGTSSAGGG